MNQTNGKLHIRRLQALFVAGVLAAGFGLAPAVDATPLTIISVVGGVPVGTGNTYENFDSLALNQHTGTYSTGSGIDVTFTPDAQAVQGASNGVYAPPFLSNSNGVLFGDNTVSGADTTTYLAAGSTSANPGAQVVLELPTSAKYLGLLWGSVDHYNTLEFWSQGTLIGSIVGGDVSAFANGDQGEQGTFYVNINSTESFDKVIATSSQQTFEFDNVAFNAVPFKVPEPRIAVMFLFGLLLVGSARLLQGRRLG